MDNRKKLVTALTASTAGGAIIVSTVAISCEAASETDNTADLVLVESELRILSESSALPRANSNGAYILDELLLELQASSNQETSDIDDITAINISNTTDNIIINNSNDSITIVAESMTIDTVGGAFSTYRNDEDLVIRNIVVFNEDVISSFSLSQTNFIPSITDAEFLRDTFFNLTRNVNGNPPANSAERVIYDVLLNTLDEIFMGADPGVIQSITVLAEGTSNSNIRDAIIVSDDASTITIASGNLIVITDSTSVSRFQNVNVDFVLSGLVVSNAETIAQQGGVITGISAVFNAVGAIQSAFASLNGATVEPPNNPNAAVLYNAFFNALNNVDNDITAITSISISDVDNFVSPSPDGTTWTIVPNAMTFTTVGGAYSLYENEDTSIIVSGIVVDLATGLIISTPSVNSPMNVLIDQPTNDEIIFREVETIYNLSSIPDSGTSARLLWDELLAVVQVIDDQITGINSISVSNPQSQALTVASNGNFATITGDSIFIETIGGTITNDFSNASQELTISNIILDTNGQIVAVGQILGIQRTPSPEELLLFFATGLNALTTATSANNPSILILYETILERLTSIDASITDITINIASPLSTNISVTPTSITFLQGALSIITNSAISEYVNLDDDFTMQIGFNSTNSQIVSATTVSNFTANPTNTEVITNAMSELTNSAISVPSSLSTNALSLYNIILAEATVVNQPGEAVTLITNITINQFDTSFEVNEATTGIRIINGQLLITGTNASGDTVDFNNQNADFIINGLVINQGVISPNIDNFGGVSGLEPELTVTQVARRAAIALQFTSVPPDTNPNALAIWNAINSAIIAVEPAVNSISRIEILDLSSVTYFTGNQVLTIAANNLSVAYNSFLAPGTFVNQTDFHIVVSVDSNDNLTVSNFVGGAFSLTLTSTSNRLQLLWREIINATSDDFLNNLSVSGVRLIFGFMQFIGLELNNNTITTFIFSDISSSVAPSFSSSGIVFIPGSLTIQGTSFDTLGVGTEITLSSLTPTDPITLSGLDENSFSGSGNGTLEGLNVNQFSGTFSTQI